MCRIIRKSRFAERNSNSFEKKSKLCKSARRRPGCKFCRAGRPLAAIPTSNAAAQVRRNWADITEEVNPGAEEGFTLVQGRKRRRGSGNSPTTAAPSSNAGASRTIRRPQSSAGSVPRAQEIRATRAHIADARARQASSSEEHCVYIEHSPELEPFHYLRALDRKLGGTAGVIQITKVNGHQLLGLTNRGLAERLISEGLEVEGTLLRAFPFRKRAERITVGNLPFFVEDSAVITALSPYGRVTSIAPKQMKAGPYVYVDGRRDVFIALHEGITIERLPTRLDINIKGQAWPAYLSSGIRCSRCHGQGHRRAICPLLAGLANNTRMAPPTTPAGVPPPTTSAPPQRSAAQPPAPAPSNLAMEVCSAPPMARAVLHPSALRPSPPAAPALPMEETPPAPPPVTPAPPLQVPKNPVDPRSATPRHPEPTPPARPDFAAPRGPPPIQETLGPAAPTQDVEMSIVAETTASSASSTRNATGDDLVAFIEGTPSVSFARTDALSLGREEVLDLLSSRTKAQRIGPLLSPPQCDALVGLIGQILDLKPGHTSNLYKVLGQVRAELTKTPAAAPTPPLPAPRPTGPTPPVPHEEQMTDEQEDVMIFKIFRKLKHMTCLRPLYDTGIDVNDLKDAILFTEDRASLMTKLSPALKGVLAEFLGAAIELARGYHHDVGTDMAKRNSNSFEKKSKLCKSARRRPGCKFCRAGRPLAAIPTSNAAAQVRRNWADITEEVNPGAEEGFTLVQGRKRRRGSGNSPTTAAPSSNAGASRTIRRPQSSAGSVPRAQEIRATRAHIADARARQASSSEEHCVYIEHSPELEPFHYLRALDRKLGGTAGVIQITKVNGHQLLGLTNRGLAERLISEGLEVEGTLLRAFPFRKRAERITVGNLPFFVEDSAVITALSPYGRVTSIAPKQMKAGPYVYVDGRRDVFIALHEGITIERLPTRLDINIKGQAWPAYLSSGIRCSRCHGQGHRRAICPLLAGLANNTRMAPPTTPAGVPPPTTSAPPQRSAAQPPAPAPSNLAMEVCSAPPMARAVLHPSALRPSPPAAPALPMEETPPAPPPVTPAPPLQVPKNPVDPRSATPRHPEPTPPARPDFAAPRGPPPIQETLGPAAPTQDVEMSIVAETTASSASSTRNATGDDLVAFIEGTPSVSFARTDALSLGREEVLDLLSSRTKAQRIGPLLSPPQCDALVGLIGQILDLKPGHTSNLYKVLGQVRAELTKTPAAAPTPPLPAPRPTGPTPPVPHEEQMTDEQEDVMIFKIFRKLKHMTCLRPLYDTGIDVNDLKDAILFTEDRASLMTKLSPALKGVLAEFLGAAIELARGYHHDVGTDMARSAGQKPGRPSIPPPTGSENSAKNEFYREIYKENSNTQEYANPPADGGNVNLAAARVDVTSGSAATLSSNSAALAIRNWADYDEDMNPGTDNDFTVVKTEKRRRESSNSPTAAASSSNSGGARSSRRLQSSARSVPRAQEIPTTRAHITEARARQASSSEEHCVYLEHGPELQPFHYLRALDRLLGGTAGIIQISKVNGHQLLGLANRGLAERLINNGLEVEGTLLRAFPFRKRAERITVGNFPFFVEDSAIIKALGPYGRLTSIAPKMMKAGPYTYTDGRLEAFIVLHEGVTTERLPTRLNITIKGEAWPAYLSSGIKCSRCHGQGHRRANCPLLAGRTAAPGPATPTSPTSVPSATALGLPQQPSAQPPPPASLSPTMEVSDVPPTSRAALHPPAALRQSPPAPSALPAEDAPLAPPPVTPAPSLRTPGSREPAAPTPDVEMSIVEETSASSASSAKNATRIDLDAFIERHPSVSFAGTDALGLGREEVLDLLSSRTKAQRNRPLLSPPQGDALAGLIGQILDLRPGAASNLYKVLGQVKAELRTTPAAVPTPPLPAPRPDEPAPPAPHGEKTTPNMATSPPPLSPRFTDERWKQAHDIIDALGREPYSEHLSELRLSEGDITDAIICPEDREPLLRRLSTLRKNILAEIIGAAIERARDIHPFAPVVGVWLTVVGVLLTVVGVWLTVVGVWFTVDGVWLTVVGVWLAVVGVWLAVVGVWLTVVGVWLAVVGVWLTVVGVWLTVIGVWLAVVGVWLAVVGVWLAVVGVWLTVVGVWLTVVGVWLTVVGVWLTVVGVWLVVVGVWLAVVGVWLTVVGVWLAVVGVWLTVVGVWLTVIGVWLAVVGYLWLAVVGVWLAVVGVWLAVVGVWLTVVGVWLTVVGVWLAVVGVWLAVVGVWLAVVGVWLAVVGVWLAVVGVWLTVVGVWLTVVGVWLAVVGVWLAVVGVWLTVVSVWLTVVGVWLVVGGVWLTVHIHVKCNSTCVRSVVMNSNREFENRAAIIVALRAGRSPKEIVDFLKLPKTTIYRVKKQFDEADSNKEGIATRKKHSRRSDRVRGEEFVKNVKEKIDGNPGKSMRAIAKEMDVGSMTIVRTIHEDLGLKSYALRKGQLLTENMKNNRKGKAAALLNNLKHDSFGMLRFFSDEKNFDVDQKVNPRNDRWICKDPSEIPVVMHTKFPASVMVLGVISSEGDVMPPHFFEKGLRMNADTYINVLESVVKPWMDMVAAGRKYVFQQDSAPAHKAKKTQSWLTLNVPSHWGPDIWPPNSPDCNPLDYYVWGVVERDVNKAPHTTIQSVKKAVHTVMTQMDK
ncbi:hypothetical protein LAZ67_15002969, partial [Cordylochernes scorpioides]